MTHPEIKRLAAARYPNEPSSLATHFFLNDRHHAGLGALDESRRSRQLQKGYQARKFTAMGVVVYKLKFYEPRRGVAEDFRPTFAGANAATARYFVNDRAEIALAIDLTARSEDFEHPIARARLADRLRAARNELRRAVAEARR